MPFLKILRVICHSLSRRKLTHHVLKSCQIHNSKRIITDVKGTNSFNLPIFMFSFSLTAFSNPQDLRI